MPRHSNGRPETFKFARGGWVGKHANHTVEAIPNEVIVGFADAAALTPGDARNILELAKNAFELDGGHAGGAVAVLTAHVQTG